MTAKKTKNVWTAEHEATMLEMQALIITTRKAVTWLTVAQRCECSPEYLQTLIKREYTRKLQQMQRVGEWVRKQGGQFLTGKSHEDGEVYSWVATFPLEDGYYLMFDFGRYHGVDAFDIPIDFDITLNRKRNKKKAERLSAIGSQIQIETIADVKRAYADAVKTAREEIRC